MSINKDWKFIKMSSPIEILCLVVWHCLHTSSNWLFTNHGAKQESTRTASLRYTKATNDVAKLTEKTFCTWFKCWDLWCQAKLNLPFFTYTRRAANADQCSTRNFQFFQKTLLYRSNYNNGSAYIWGTLITAICCSILIVKNPSWFFPRKYCLHLSIRKISWQNCLTQKKTLAVWYVVWREFASCLARFDCNTLCQLKHHQPFGHPYQKFHASNQHFRRQKQLELKKCQQLWIVGKSLKWLKSDTRPSNHEIVAMWGTKLG